MTFKNFVQAAYVTNSPRGAFIADLKTLINAGVFPAEMYGWNDFYSFLAFQGRKSPGAIAEARRLWRQYQAKTSAREAA